MNGTVHRIDLHMSAVWHGVIAFLIADQDDVCARFTGPSATSLACPQFRHQEHYVLYIGEIQNVGVA